MRIPKSAQSTYGLPGTLEITIPIKAQSEANTREHWRVKANRKHKQRNRVAFELAKADWPRQKPRVIHFTRIGKRELDSDNLQSAFKQIRDEVCARLGCDDGDKAIRFEYDQRTGKEYAIVIKVEL